VYGATKAAVDSFTKSWALELAPRKIRVNAVAPGYVQSDMTAQHFSDPEVLRRAVERSPFGRLGNAEEVADVVLFLCSPAARWITGQSLNVSGGFVI
jgi:NAD(P)-dependent dehydrogenase (short-subunit alcohol dehydrogenase family)